MLFQLVTGRLPFDADSPLAIAYAHVQEEPPVPSSINRSLPPAVDALVARALKKNPNERFPTAESMRDECLRVAASFQAAPPSIVPGAPTQSGSGVGSAVFPPVGQTTHPPQPGVQTPYQPTPAPAPNPYSTPAPTPSPAYGYPQQGGYPTPNPQPYAQQGGAATPPPYTLNPQQGPSSPQGGGRSSRPVIIGSAVVAVIAVVGLIAALSMRGDDGGSDAGSDNASPSASHAAGYRGPDTSRTIESSECSEPKEGYDDPDKIEVPDFRFKYIASVKACMSAAGWKIKTTTVDENIYGEGAVINQFPTPGTEVDPQSVEIQVGVSSGNPPA
jgi:hypothetical protein